MSFAGFQLFQRGPASRAHLRPVNHDGFTSYSTTGFGKDVAEGAATTAANLHLDLTSTAFAPSQAPAMAPAVPDGDVLLVVGNFADELGVASLLLTRPWRFAAFVGAGVDEVLTTLGNQREGLLGPAQWLPTAAIEPDEGPDSDWFVEAYRKEVELILLTLRHKLLRQAFYMHDVCETRRKQPTQPFRRWLKR